MSFSKDLWGGFNSIINNFSLRRKALKEILFIITEKSELENEYSKNLNRIFEFDYNLLSEGSLSRATKSFKNNLNSIHCIYSSTISNVQSNIINKMKNFLILQVNKSKEKIKIVNSTETDFKFLINNMNSFKSQYHSLGKALEEVKIQLEVSKNSNNSNKNKLESKLEGLSIEAKDAEDKYIRSLKEVNSFKNFYIKKIENILDAFEGMERDYNEFIKEIMIEYNKEMYNCMISISKIYEDNVLSFNQVNPKKDLIDNIFKYQTNILPPKDVTFTPYTTNIDKNKINKYIDETSIGKISFSEISSNLRNFVKTIFLSNIPDSPNVNEVKVINEMKNILSNSWEGKDLLDEEIKVFDNNIKEKGNRKIFLSSFNKYRIKGLFILDEKSYSTLSLLLNKVIDSSAINKDYENLKFCIILSQTFFKPNNEVLNFFGGDLNKVTEIKDTFVNIKESSPIKSGNRQENKGDSIQIEHNLIENEKEKNSNSNETHNRDNQDKNFEMLPINDRMKVSNKESNLNEEISNKASSKEINLNLNKKEKTTALLVPPKIYIQNAIQYNEHLQNSDNWKEMIKYSIKEELSLKSEISFETLSSTSENICSSTGFESENNKIEMLKIVSFGQLISFGFNMISFGIKRNLIIKIIEDISFQNFVSEEMKINIITKLQETTEEYRNEINNFINDSLNPSFIEDNSFKKYIENTEKNQIPTPEMNKEVNNIQHQQKDKDKENDMYLKILPESILDLTIKDCTYEIDKVNTENIDYNSSGNFE